MSDELMDEELYRELSEAEREVFDLSADWGFVDTHKLIKELRELHKSDKNNERKEANP